MKFPFDLSIDVSLLRGVSRSPDTYLAAVPPKRLRRLRDAISLALRPELRGPDELLELLWLTERLYESQSIAVKHQALAIHLAMGFSIFVGAHYNVCLLADRHASSEVLWNRIESAQFGPALNFKRMMRSGAGSRLILDPPAARVALSAAEPLMQEVLDHLTTLEQEFYELGPNPRPKAYRRFLEQLRKCIRLVAAMKKAFPEESGPGMLQQSAN